MKRSTVNIIAGTIVVLGLAGWTAYQQIYRNHDASLKQDNSAAPKSCSEDQLTRLELSIDGKSAWSRPHSEILNMEGSVPAPDIRFELDRIVPVADIIKDYPDARTVEVISCDYRVVTLKMTEIAANRDAYVFRPNRKGMLRLQNYKGEENYKTLLRGVISINLKS